ncbi:MAG: protease modulator HflC, partial [Nevskia sp.]|nr:protease modulator HflC [Nevskia sp.]
MNNPLNLLLGTLLAALLASSSVYVLDQRSVAVLLQFDKYQATVLEPGLHFKLPFAQSVYKMDRRLLTGRQTSNIPLAGQESVDVDYYVKWRIADVAAYYRAVGGQAQLANDRLLQSVNASLRQALGSRTLEQIVTGDREPLDESLVRDTQPVAHELGI